MLGPLVRGSWVGGDWIAGVEAGLVGGRGDRSGCGGSLNDAEDCAESVGSRVGLCASCGLLGNHS